MIHERGYWLSTEETKTHDYDKTLHDTVMGLISNKLHTIIDIGCGDGKYTKNFNENGFDCIGFDGSPLTPEFCNIKDFSDPVDVGKFDLVFSIEVGEHIPVEYEQIFIDNICNTAKNDIIISWALVGQHGTGHVNCRNNDYIINEMSLRGFSLDPVNTILLRESCTLPWFKNTIMYFKK